MKSFSGVRSQIMDLPAKLSPPLCTTKEFLSYYFYQSIANGPPVDISKSHFDSGMGWLLFHLNFDINDFYRLSSPGNF